MKKPKVWIAVIVLLCAVIVAGGVFYVTTRGQPAAATAAEPFTPQLDPNATEPQTAEDAAAQEPVGIRIPGYPTITIPADTQTVSVNLMNPEGNPCYFTFELVLTDTEESLYTSAMVEPGKAITQINLPRGLPAGEYPAVLKITTNSLEDGSAMNGANVETILVAK